MYWWVWALHEGKIAVFSPPYNSEEEASAWGFQHRGNDFEIEEMKTRNRAEATRAIKRIVFEKTSNLDLALQRAKHNLSEKENK